MSANEKVKREIKKCTGTDRKFSVKDFPMQLLQARLGAVALSCDSYIAFEVLFTVLGNRHGKSFLAYYSMLSRYKFYLN